MKIKKYCWKILSGIGLCILVWSMIMLAQSRQEPELKLRFLSTPVGFDVARAAALAKAVDFQNWPQTETKYVAPVITRALLAKPESVTRSSISYSLAEFEGTPWGKCHVSWARLIKNERPAPREFSPERKKELLARLPVEKQKDERFVVQYLERKLERFRQSQQFILDGELNIEICLTPNSRAAQEYLLTAMTGSSLPTESLVSMYAAARREQGLGTMNLVTGSPGKNRTDIRCVRGNLYLSIRASGCFAGEALALARAIDAQVAGQTMFTREQLLQRRPEVKIAAQLKGQPAAPYDIGLTPGNRIVYMRALVDDKETAVKEKAIVLPDKKGKSKVKLIVLTDELLAGIVEQEIDVSPVKDR